MADLPAPAPCNPEVFAKGVVVLLVSTGAPGGNRALELWVRGLAKAAGCPIDWHYYAGRARILALGDQVEVGRLGHKRWLNDPPKDPEGEPMTLLWAVELHDA